MLQTSLAAGPSSPTQPAVVQSTPGLGRRQVNRQRWREDEGQPPVEVFFSKGFWLVVFSHPFEKYDRQIGSFPQLGMEI